MQLDTAVCVSLTRGASGYSSLLGSLCMYVCVTVSVASHIRAIAYCAMPRDRTVSASLLELKNEGLL